MIEYSTSNTAITGQGTYSGFQISDAVLSARGISNVITQDQIVEILSQVVNQGSIVNTYNLYVAVHIASTLRVVNSDGRNMCEEYYAYHSTLNSAASYGVIPSYCQDKCPLTVSATHELAKAITDPYEYTAWYDDVKKYEIGDKCNLQSASVMLNGAQYDVTKIWSNQKNACVPFERPDLACLYNDLNFGGDEQCFKDVGYHDVAQNDQASSIYVKPGCVVKAAVDGGMTGNNQEFIGNVGWLGDEWNDVISSLTITCS